MSVRKLEVGKGSTLSQNPSPNYLSNVDLSMIDLDANQYSYRGKRMKGGAPQYDRNIAKHISKQDGYSTLSKVFVPKLKEHSHLQNPNHPQHVQSTSNLQSE
ncbi:hypothetical protein Ciccas_001009 [Cichlidogyrus casuarinus]|uniref:Uncharacterized protein n=1 Tax=Cichlidogyrus casuarinus TaxID=1844966 RepID=A0ABD2QLC3_9PLAT